MNIDRFISNIKNLREAAPTNSVANGGVQNFDKFLFPRDEDLLSQDYQTPAEVGDSKDDFLGVYPVMKLQLDKSSDGPSIDSMVDASKEYFNAIDQTKIKAKVIDAEFLEEKNGTSKVISFFSKKARGAMANFIVKNKIIIAKDLQNFDLNGYRFNQELSSSRKYVYSRSL